MEFDDLRALEEEYYHHAEQWQKNITYGDHFIRVWDGLLIYGHIMTKEEFTATEAALGADEAEINYEWSTLQKAYNRGYRYGWCYSQVEPDGELGSTHVTAMDRKITPEQFANAKHLGWPLDR